MEIREHIGDDLLCVGCGYNLRGTPEDGACPECDVPAVLSIHPTVLRNANPHWLGNLRRGAQLKLLTVVVAVGIVVMSRIVPGPSWSDDAWRTIGLLTHGLLYAGTLLMTTQEPRCSLTESPTSLRRAVRVLATLVFLGLCIRQSSSVLPVTGDLHRPGLLLLTIIGAVNAVLALMYLGVLARRVPDPALVTSTSRVIGASVVTGGSAAFMIIDGMLGARITGVRLWGIVVVPGAYAVLTTVVALWYFVLIWRYYCRFRDAGRKSRDRWLAQNLM